jgi:hypothetical protein
MAIVNGLDLDTNLAGLNGAISLPDNGRPVALAPRASVSATGSFSGQTLLISGLLPEDKIGFGHGVFAFGNTVFVGWLPVGSFTGGVGGADLVITFNGFASPAAVQKVLRGITVRDTDDAPAADHTLTINLAGTVRTETVGVIAINDAPVVDLNGAGFGKNAAALFVEQTAIAIAPQAALTDPDSPNLTSLTATLVSRPDGNATESLSLNAAATMAAATAGLVVSYNAATGQLAITGSASQATYQTILQGIVYDNASDDPSGLARSINVVVSDGVMSSTSRNVVVGIVPVNDVPVIDLNGVPSGTSTRVDVTVGAAPTAIAPVGTIVDADSSATSSTSRPRARSGSPTPRSCLSICCPTPWWRR